MSRTSISFNEKTDENFSLLRSKAKQIKNLRKEPSDSMLISSIVNFLAERSDLDNVMFENLDELRAQDGRGKHRGNKSITYLIHDKEAGLHKIGQSATPMERLKTLRKVYNESLEIIGVSSNVSEKDLNFKYQKHLCPQEAGKDGFSEWFYFDSNTLEKVIQDLST